MGRFTSPVALSGSLGRTVYFIHVEIKVSFTSSVVVIAVRAIGTDGVLPVYPRPVFRFVSGDIGATKVRVLKIHLVEFGPIEIHAVDRCTTQICAT